MASASSYLEAPSYQGEEVLPSYQVEVPCLVASQVVPCLEALAYQEAFLASSYPGAWEACQGVPWVVSLEVLPSSEEVEWHCQDTYPASPS